MTSEAGPAHDGAALLLAVPEDVLALISAYLRPRDLCALASCSRGLQNAVSTSEKAWLAQCLRAPRAPPPALLPRWRAAVMSYRALCRFLHAAAPLLGVWVHQNPELGNVVLAMWGLASVVGCRVLPQELGPLGLHAGPLLWAPVFEVLPSADGAPAMLFLHGRDRDSGSSEALCLGSVAPVHPSCNVLLLEADVRPDPSLSKPQQSLHSQILTSASENEISLYSSSLRRLCRSDTTVASQPVLPGPAAPPPFSRLAFGDRRRLLELIALRAKIKLPPELAMAPLFPGCCTSSSSPSHSRDDDNKLLESRRSTLVELHELHGGRIDRRTAELKLAPMAHTRNLDPDGSPCLQSKRRSFASVTGYFKDGLRQFIRRSESMNGTGLSSRNGGGSAHSESKHVPLHEFFRAGDTVGLSLRAVSMKLSTYRAWPNMPDNKFALYKLPMKPPTSGREYAGLWGGTFGWPPGRPSEDKPGKALFLLLISYEEVEGNLLLVATKILEGTHYVLHPNGSAMFTVKVDEPALEPFPWEFDGDSLPVEVKQAYSGEGIASGYGFRYPGSKPGSLFVMQNGLIAFVWRESKAVLTLHRMDLEELLKKGERVPALSPIANFSYLTKSYSNVFAGFHSISNCSNSPRGSTNPEFSKWWSRGVISSKPTVKQLKHGFL